MLIRGFYGDKFPLLYDNAFYKNKLIFLSKKAYVKRVFKTYKRKKITYRIYKKRESRFCKWYMKEHGHSIPDPHLFYTCINCGCSSPKYCGIDSRYSFFFYCSKACFLYRITRSTN